MSTPLIANDLGFIRTHGGPSNPGPHCIDLFRSDARLFLKITLNGRNPGGGTTEVNLELLADQAQDLIDGLTQGHRSL